MKEIEWVPEERNLEQWRFKEGQWKCTSKPPVLQRWEGPEREPQMVLCHWSLCMVPGSAASASQDSLSKRNIQETKFLGSIEEFVSQRG